MTANLSNISDLEEFDGHELVMRLEDASSGLEGYIALYNPSTKPSCFGATRIWNYSSEADALKDVLKLSKTMAYKAAMADLGYGGAKGVIMRKRSDLSEDLLKAYARKVEFFSGKFITGTDVGMTRNQLVFMKRYSKFFVGTSANPERFTAMGVYKAMKICAKEVWGTDDLSRRVIAIQGLGKTGMELLKLVYDSGFKKLYITDIKADIVKHALKKYSGLEYVKPDIMSRKKVDIFSPCAIFSAVNSKNIGKIRCKLIAGTANNQLEKESMGEILSKWGVLYAPDYVINAGGLISVVDEYENGNCRVGRVKDKLRIIEKNIKKVLAKSKRTSKATNIVANEYAEKKL
ncbi:leucine dehydrogenase [Candidatus Woesebacteria bacterium]|nr:leucine dehydrogenase [Candidatus Woesebacteria bacterium]